MLYRPYNTKRLMFIQGLGLRAIPLHPLCTDCWISPQPSFNDFAPALNFEACMKLNPRPYSLVTLGPWGRYLAPKVEHRALRGFTLNGGVPKLGVISYLEVPL